MAFSIPSIAEIGTRAKNAFRSFLPGTDAWIEPNNLSVTSRALSLVNFEVYQRILWLYKQLFASTADTYHLENRHAFEYGLTRKASTPAIGPVILTQVITGAQTAPSGIRLLRDDGVSYLTTTAAVFSAGSASVSVQAEQTGATTNAPAGSTLTVEQSPSVPNLNDAATVDTAGIGGGADAEDDNSLRSRVLFRKRNPPHGGAPSDYQIWATSVPGCTAAYVAPFTNSPGAVTLYPLFDLTRLNGIPTTADLNAVAAYIETVRPVTAKVFVLAATAVPVNVTIHNLANDTPATRASIVAQLTAMFAERCPVSLASSLFTLPLAWIYEAIGRATGEVKQTLTAPTTDTSFTAGQRPVLGTVTFT